LYIQRQKSRVKILKSGFILKKRDEFQRMFMVITVAAYILDFL